MAVDLERDASQYFYAATPPVTAVPFTMGFWGRIETGGLNQCGLFIGDKDVADNYFSLEVAPVVNENYVRMRWRDSTYNRSKDTTSALAGAGVWFHACCVHAAGDHRVYLDGGGKNSTANDTTPVGIDLLAIGCRYDGSAGTYWDGMIAEAFVANAAWSDDDVAAVAAGVPPTLVRPDTLVFYQPLIRNLNVGHIGADIVAASGAGAPGPHPPIMAPLYNYRQPAVLLRQQSASISALIQNVGAASRLRLRARVRRGAGDVYTESDGVRIGVQYPPEAP